MSDPLDDTPANLAARLGAHVTDSGVEFALWSPSATRVELLLFEAAGDLEPREVVGMVPSSSGIWYAAPESAAPGTLYGFRALGPASHGFDGDKLLLDPCARAIAPSGRPAREAARRVGSNLATAPKAVVIDCRDHGRRTALPLRRELEGTLVYELHVRGFTRHESSGVEPARAGTYAGLVDRIPHLVQLGVTAVELMPVQAFDVEDAFGGRENYWGYSPLAWFAPHPGFAAAEDPAQAVEEFRDMVRALHEAGIEVWLDVVFNHTAEGSAEGPTWHLRGSAGREAYLHGEDGELFDVTGCGNTVNANHPMVAAMIVECLVHWVEHMHVDGFRFDLAAALTRGEDGTPFEDPPLIRAISGDPRLAGTRLVAEAWDIGDNYLVGRFPGEGWIDWNDRFRDDLRCYLRGDEGSLDALAVRLAGSHDLYQGRPTGVGYVCCHDGFTLNDLVSYSHKHNDDNGEEGRDGSDENRSWNHGHEGPTTDVGIQQLRSRQVRNALTITLLAPGPAQLLMGDELRRTQGGNNNAYSQDNEVSWLDWGLARQNAELVQLVARLADLRSRLEPHRVARRADTNHVQELDEERGVALCEERHPDLRLLLVLNRSDHAQELHLPEGDWELVITTEEATGEPRPGTLAHSPLLRAPRSVAVLLEEQRPVSP